MAGALPYLDKSCVDVFIQRSEVLYREFITELNLSTMATLETEESATNVHRWLLQGDMGVIWHQLLGFFSRGQNA